MTCNKFIQISNASTYQYRVFLLFYIVFVLTCTAIDPLLNGVTLLTCIPSPQLTLYLLE